MKKSSLLLCIAAGVLAVGGAITPVIINNHATDSSTNVGEEDDVKLVSNLFNLDNLRAKVSSLAPTSEVYSSSQKGLLLYGYDSGAKASYKQILNGEVTFKSIANTQDKKTPNLVHYSYQITDIDSNESFKIHVITAEKVTTYYVEADGKNAGEAYFSSINGLITHGYSKLYNNNGTYTQVTSTGLNIDSKIKFNPTNMSIVVEGQTKDFEVWNFKDDFIDGKSQIKHLNSFSNYKVDIIFEEVIANSKAELVLYEIGNKTFDSAILNNPTTLVADLSLKGVVNKPYYLPTPYGENPENVEVWVYKEGSDGEAIQVMNSKLSASNTFTPDSVGSYYVLYKGLEGELRDKITVISSETCTSSFTSTVLDGTNYGFKSVITVPDLVFSTNRSEKDLSSLVTIKLGDKVVSEAKKPGFDFAFDKHDRSTLGVTNYTFEYRCENSNITDVVTKTVAVNSSNGASYFLPYLENYATGTNIDISKGLFYKDGEEIVCNADVVYPSGSKVVTYEASQFGSTLPKLTLDANGTYTIRYYNDAKGANFVTKFRSMPKVDELFSTVDATTRFASSSTSDINQGVVGSFKNDGTITYNKLVDVTKLSKDDKLISLMAQPKVPGTAEISNIFITVEDEYNPDNYFEVRLAQGSDNVSDKTFIRAQATGQKYGGYYYNSWFDIDSNIAVDRWFNDLSFGANSSISFNEFECKAISTTVSDITKMKLTIDHNRKNLHFIQDDISRSSFKNDLADFIAEFDDEISTRLGNGKLTKADIGTVHEPEITWQADAAHDQGGFLHEHSFTSAMDTYSYENVDYVDLYYDNADKALYTNFWYHVAGYPTEARVVKMCDFDDPKTFGVEKAWTGFLSKNVRISVRATGVSGETGDVLVREIAGNKFNNDLLGDDDSPFITIDDAFIPNAKVGTPFKPLEATYSDMTSAVETKTITVTDPNGDNVPLVNGEFIPQIPGNYVITYTVADSFGNESSKSITIVAKEPELFNPFTSSLNVEDGKDVQYGINYELPEPVVSGGSGKYKVEKTVTVTNGGETLNLEVENNKVKVLHTGTYTVNVKCTDYLGEVSQNSYTFRSTFSSDPIFDDSLILPERLFKGVPYPIGQFTCRLFEKEGEEQKIVNLKARVTDGSGTRVLGEDMLYTPDCTGAKSTAKVELFVNTNSHDVVLAEETVEVIDLSVEPFVLNGYFINSANVETSAFFGCMLLVSNDESGVIESRFVNPIIDDSVSLTFSQYYKSGKNKENLSHLDNFVVTLTDFENPNISFDIVYTQKTDAVYATLPNNSDEKFKVSASFTDINNNGDMGFTFKKSSNSIVDISGSSVGKITKCSNGDNFEGFTSGKVLVSMKANGVVKDNGLYLKKLAGIALDDSKTDLTAPSLVINGSYGGYVQEGQEVTLPSASAYDVLSYCGTPTLSIYNAQTKEYVKDVNGLVMNEVPTDKAYTVSFPSFGEYTVEYKAVDSAGNVANVSAYPYYVTDSEPASLTFHNSLADDYSSAALFSSVNVLDYTLTDNAGAEGCMVSIYVVLPTSEVITLKTDVKDIDSGEITTTYGEKCKDGNFEFTGVGNYQIIYLVTDSNGNICAITKTVTVK